jgi:hypothetical protein
VGKKGKTGLGEQRIRSVLYHLSLVVFFAGLPFIMSFSLGYKFDRRTFRFTRTGLIVLKTQPAGAGIRMDGALMKEKTPAVISELLPGRHNLELSLDGYYPYACEVDLEAGKVFRSERVILFPVRPNIMQLNKERISFFWVDQEKGFIYYINRAEHSVYRSDLEGGHFRKIGSFSPILPHPKQWHLSSDKKKLLYFNAHQVGLIFLKPDDESYFPETVFILNYPGEKIAQVFWHSDDYHIVVVSEKNISICEARPRSQALTLVRLNKKSSYSFYDVRADALYFIDSQKAPDGNYYDNLYKLDLSARIYSLQDFMKQKPVFENTGVEPYEQK